MRLKDYIQRDLVFTRIVADDRNELNRMITKIVTDRFSSVDAVQLLTDLNTQDRVACAEGDCIIGVPNAFSDSLPDTVCIVARVLPRSNNGTTENIRIGFFVISPGSKTMTHMRLIARITRFACHSGFCSDLAAIEDPDEFYQRLIDEDNRHV